MDIIEKIKERLCIYFADGYYEILDGGISWDGGELYEAVSWRYIRDYVLDDLKFEDGQLCKALFDLIWEGVVRANPCGHAGTVVFSSEEAGHNSPYLFDTEKLFPYMEGRFQSLLYVKDVQEFNDLKDQYK